MTRAPIDRAAIVARLARMLLDAARARTGTPANDTSAPTSDSVRPPRCA